MLGGARWLAALLCVPLLGPSVPAAGAESDAAIAVVATIKPIHALAARVMEGVGTPRLLIAGGASPHTFTLKPSDARMLEHARVVFRVGDAIEPFMVRVMRALPRSVEVVTLLDTPGLTLHHIRRGGTFERHDHGAHEHAEDGRGGEAGHDHDEAESGSGIDAHIWLDPEDARLIGRRMAEVLAAADPTHAARYRANAAALSTSLEALEKDIARQLKPLAARPFIVFHDAYQYFERRFGLAAAGSVTLGAELAPSAKRLSALRRKVLELGAVCVFTEPQFEPRLVATIAEGTRARVGVLDPLGASLEPGSQLYGQLLEALAASLRACLSPR